MTMKQAKLLKLLRCSSIAVTQSIRGYQSSLPRLSKPDIRYLYVTACLIFRSRFRDTPRHNASFP